MKRILKWRVQSDDETRELSHIRLNINNSSEIGTINVQQPCPLNGLPPDYRSSFASSSRNFSELAQMAAFETLPSYNSILTAFPPQTGPSGFLPPPMGFSPGILNSTMLLPHCQTRLNLPTVKVQVVSETDCIKREKTHMVSQRYRLFM